MKILLVGQPNAGKSTIFNSVAGYRSISANFPGSTVHYTLSQTKIDGASVEVVDLPGTYSLSGSSAAENATRQFLCREKFDVIIHVADASLLQRSLELTIQLLELQFPMVLCLNMMDDAERKGIQINANRLSGLLGIPVCLAMAQKGKGIPQLFDVALRTAKKQQRPEFVPTLRKDVERTILVVQNNFHDTGIYPFSARSLAIKILEEDELFADRVSGETREFAARIRNELEENHGDPAAFVIEAERHALSMHLAEQATIVGKPRRDVRDRLDDLLMHPIWGYAILLLILFSFFIVVFRAGSVLEGAMLGQFSKVEAALLLRFASESAIAVVVRGAIQGMIGGLVIVLPYLIPFLLGLALLEDIGYLPRVAFLMDALMHRLGLHGTAILPIILGYGCSVPAVMATRILHSPRDRFIAAVISILVPCSARTTVILALTGFYLGGGWAFGLYVLNIAVITLCGRILSRLMPQLIPGMILEVPRYQWPVARLVVKKTWFRMREFVRIAWPLLILGSVILSVAQAYGWADRINTALSPLTVAVLGLPVVVGTTLIFGVLRKEMSLLMLITALGTTSISNVMTSAQILTFTVFVMFYVPCVATLGVLAREIGKRFTLYAAVYTFVLATITAAIVRLIFNYTSAF